MNSPLYVQPEKLHKSGSDMRDAATEASRALKTSRDDAAKARPGFPGDAAAPFQAMLGVLEKSDSALLSAVKSTGGKVSDAGSAYDSTDWWSALSFGRILP